MSRLATCVANAPMIFRVGLQGLTAQSTMEAELVGAALTMKEEVVFCSNVILELGFDKSYGSVPLFIDNTSALHIAGNHTYIPRAKHIVLRYYFFVQNLVEGKISTHYIKSEGQLADLGTKHLSKHRHRNFIKLINEFKAQNAKIVSSSTGRSSSPLTKNTCVLLTIFSALCSYLQRCTYTALLFYSY